MPASICGLRTSTNGRELKQHGTAQLPAAFYDDDLTRMPVPWHWHDELEAGIITGGTAIIAAGTEKRALPEGTAFLISSGVLHAAWDGGGGNSRIHSIVFHPRLVGGSPDSVFWQKYLRPVLAHPALKSVWLTESGTWHADALTHIARAWESGIAEGSGFELTVREELSRLMLLLSGQSPSSGKPPSEKELRDGERIKAMLDFIHGHFAEELTASEIASRAFISESECLRCFKGTIGSTPVHYLKGIRLQHAAERLASTDDKITRIGADCGFQDMSYFARTFRDAYGLSPSEYRRQRRSGG